mgnify:CR=1 FL=1
MTQITQYQIDEAIRQAHVERANAMAAGVEFILNAAARSVSNLKAAIRAWEQPTPHRQN